MRLSYYQETLVRECREPAASALLEQPRQMPSAAHVQARANPSQAHGSYHPGALFSNDLLKPSLTSLKLCQFLLNLRNLLFNLAQLRLALGAGQMF